MHYVRVVMTGRFLCIRVSGFCSAPVWPRPVERSSKAARGLFGNWDLVRRASLVQIALQSRRLLIPNRTLDTYSRIVGGRE